MAYKNGFFQQEIRLPKKPSFLGNMILHTQLFFSLGKRERGSQLCLWYTRSWFVKFFDIIRFFSAISPRFKKEIFFIVRTVIHCNNFPRDLVESNHWRFSRCDWTGSQIIQFTLPFPKKVGNQMTFWDPFQPMLFYYCIIKNKRFFMYSVASLEELYFLLQLLETTSHTFLWFTAFIYLGQFIFICSSFNSGLFLLAQ